jgi:5-formaminoimidazole-4-carboxamide-1-beta-D-ribofuranosyl 5'-monophosphate synthetase
MMVCLSREEIMELRDRLNEVITDEDLDNYEIVMRELVVVVAAVHCTLHDSDMDRVVEAIHEAIYPFTLDPEW